MPADYAGVDLFQAFALLFAGSVALLTGLALLVVSRKALRDRRESKSARRRRHFRRALATGDPRRLRRVLGTVRDREQQVDLAFVLQDDSAPARRSRCSTARAAARGSPPAASCR